MTTETNRVAIVTGSSRGIGAAIARRLARDGLTVIVNYAGSANAAAKLVDEIEQAGGRAISCQADVSDPHAVARMFGSAEAAYGGVDVLVNNAGIMKLAPVAQTEDAMFDQTIAVNLKGTFNGMREAAKRLRDGGRIVSFSSSVVGLYQPSYGVYAATKAAVEALTHILAKELGPRGITVNTVAPGPVATDLFLGGKDQATIDRIKQMNPFGRLGEVDDIANVVSLLVGPDGGWINGQTVRANGGVI
ncbi:MULTISPECIES: SDR family oxidoreductase [Rhodopseudomonas]|uniref:3-ketoacyl-ACP reductase n=1 Tax=Rhodopseudomonas palustris TaxID=1076 RepID=A0A0D7EPW3_RHOPL|nr:MULTISPECIES: SDR family oxidoreductase [Rhodopseudomonas]KIZ42595.1 3-ketoacyl-ACP reductase [Rhodopseudomonas palustris]MDF3812466.1 SDR family oxidoreductase [Rhodopseudomonas sp. BAL398]WOK19464.1 SDR family oxidoreductase [Rhodopseudomonas sp. BAL398]